MNDITTLTGKNEEKIDKINQEQENEDIKPTNKNESRYSGSEINQHIPEVVNYAANRVEEEETEEESKAACLAVRLSLFCKFCEKVKFFRSFTKWQFGEMEGSYSPGAKVSCNKQYMVYRWNCSRRTKGYQN